MMKMVIKDKGNRLENTQWERMHLDQILEDAGDLSTMYPEGSSNFFRGSFVHCRPCNTWLNHTKIQKSLLKLMCFGFLYFHRCCISYFSIENNFLSTLTFLACIY